MSAKTMPNFGCLALLEGDPLGLLKLEEDLAWRTTGPLPEWLAGTDDEFLNEENCRFTPSSIALAIAPMSETPIAGPAANVSLAPSSPKEATPERVCLLVAVGARLWAIPFGHIARVGGPSTIASAVDLFERQEGRCRSGKGVTIEFESGDAVIVDRILGPRVFDWQPMSDDGDDPGWMTARTEKAGDVVGLLDWEMLAQSTHQPDAPATDIHRIS